MNNHTLADCLLIAHLAWILFMLYGFWLTVQALWRPASWRPVFWDRWLFRTIHLGGILLVATLELLGKYCPLTVWEYDLRHGATGSEPPPFVISLIEKLVYPDVDPLVYLIPTFGIAVFTLVMFVVRPPSKFRQPA